MARITKKKKSPSAYFFSIVLTATAVVFFWRGIWGLTDAFLFPNNSLLSYAVSIGLGLFILWVDDWRISELEHH
ncbi:MAG: hypothetical protein WC777_03270 [Candidatus Gracilibacteria bacterium]|jgi:hypothetical protein